MIRTHVKYLLLIALTFFCRSTTAQTIPAYNADMIAARTSNKDTVYIVNFWATWCVPCVHELPEFNALQKRYAGKPVKVLLISLDFKESYPDKLALFVQRQRLAPEVAWLSETDPNVFIPKIDNSWEGSIPATLIVHGQFKKFLEGTITAKQVAVIVDGQLN